MATSSISSYGVNSYETSSALTGSTDTSSLGMDDFLQLLVAQLTNQDVMEPMDNTEFISQMAQFTSLQAMQDLNTISATQYGASLIGKTVIVAKYDDSGNYVQDEGTIDRVNFSGDETTVMVNGNEYSLSSIMEVVTAVTTADTSAAAST